MPPRRLMRSCLLAAALALAAGGCAAAAAKVLRYALLEAETGFDPAQAGDIYSREILDNIFDAPLRFDYLARPVQVRTATAAALPEVSDDFRQFTLRIRPGIYFAADPAFKGRPRELTAADYAYSIRRHFDPRLHSVGHADLLEDQILGLEALREQAIKSGKPFDYDAPVEGLQVPDRYTLRIRLGRPSPRFSLKLAQTTYAGAVAREVAESYGDAIAEHPVGTGPFVLAEWRRSSRIVLERNPGYREEHYDEHPPADDSLAQAQAARLRGRRLPMIDRVEISVIEEPQPRWLAFLGNDFDFVLVPYEFAPLAVPGGRLAPNLARRGIVQHRLQQPDVVYTYFNMDDPVVGGYTPEKVALRRAVGLAYDNAEEVRLLRRQLAVPAQGLVVPMVRGYAPQRITGMSDYSPERARALLDLFGYVDRDGDGWRERPDGSPLRLTVTTQNDSSVRQFNALLKKRLDAIGVRIAFDRGQFSEELKQARAGKLQMMTLSSSAGAPDPEDQLNIAYGPARGEANYSRFDLPAYNAIYARLTQLPDGPERDGLIAQAQKLVAAYMPVKAQVHRVRAILTQPWLDGYDGNPFVFGFWRYLDIDMSRRPPTGR